MPRLHDIEAQNRSQLYNELGSFWFSVFQNPSLVRAMVGLSRLTTCLGSFRSLVHNLAGLHEQGRMVSQLAVPFLSQDVQESGQAVYADNQFKYSSQIGEGLVYGKYQESFFVLPLPRYLPLLLQASTRQLVLGVDFFVQADKFLFFNEDPRVLFPDKNLLVVSGIDLDYRTLLEFFTSAHAPQHDEILARYFRFAQTPQYYQLVLAAVGGLQILGAEQTLREIIHNGFKTHYVFDQETLVVDYPHDTLAVDQTYPANFIIGEGVKIFSRDGTAWWRKINWTGGLTLDPILNFRGLALTNQLVTAYAASQEAGGKLHVRLQLSGDFFTEEKYWEDVAQRETNLGRYLNDHLQLPADVDGGDALVLDTFAKLISAYNDANQINRLLRLPPEIPDIKSLASSRQVNALDVFFETILDLKGFVVLIRPDRLPNIQSVYQFINQEMLVGAAPIIFTRGPSPLERVTLGSDLLINESVAIDFSTAFWNVEQRYTAMCPDGQVGSSTAIIGARTHSSLISQADADAIALAVAQVEAEAALVCVSASVVGGLPGGLNSAVYEPGRDVIFAVDAGNLFKLDAATGEVLDRLQFSDPQWDDEYIIYCPVDDRLYVGTWGSTQDVTSLVTFEKWLWRFNPDTMTVADKVDQGDFITGFANGSNGIRQMFFHSDNLIYFIYYDGGTHIDILRLDPTNPTAFSSFDVSASGFSTYGNLAWDGESFWCCANGTDEITAQFVPPIAGANRNNFTTVGLPPDTGPFGIVWSDRVKALYAVSASATVLWVAVPGSCQMSSSIDLGRPAANPYNIRVCPFNDYLYVPCLKDNSVVIINPVTNAVVSTLTGFTNPFDVVFTDSKAFAVQRNAPEGLKLIEASLPGLGSYVPPSVPSVPPTQLVSYYTFHEASGTRMDSKGTNHLTLFNANAVTFTAGVQGNAARFTIDSSGLEVLNAFEFDPYVGITVCFWIRIPSPFFGFISQPVSMNSFGDCAWYFDYGITGSGPFADEYGASDGNYLNAGPPAPFSLTGNAWHFVRLWVDPADRYLRRQIDMGTIDVVNKDFHRPVVTTGGRLFVGRGSIEFAICEMGIWKGSLTNGEAASVYNGGAGVTWPSVPYA